MTPIALAALHKRACDAERPWQADEFETLLAQPGHFVLGDQRAFALVRIIADESELLMLATDPPHRRQGLARDLVNAWLAKARAAHAQRAFLGGAVDNSAACALYESLGFYEAGRRKDYFRRANGDVQDALVLGNDLS